ncbi:MAG: hypothetical protein LBR34_08840 [Prevotella sp.]|jgi:hypothetical protein|nr:hypothetical protein [Prevotella sp.]
MQKITITSLPELATADAATAGNLMKKHAAAHRIDSVNWREQFDYKPDAQFYIACTPDALWLHFHVAGEKAHAVHTEDMAEVWNDSCVEFFVKKPDEAVYRNFEFNCIGYCVATIRKSRTEGIEPLSPPELRSIERYASLGRQTIDASGPTEWEITVKIPAALLGLSALKTGDVLLGNFYKCGDKTDRPHYVSWNKIDTEKPDFHRPEYFGILEFA